MPPFDAIRKISKIWIPFSKMTKKWRKSRTFLRNFRTAVLQDYCMVKCFIFILYWYIMSDLQPPVVHRRSLSKTHNKVKTWQHGILNGSLARLVASKPVAKQILNVGPQGSISSRPGRDGNKVAGGFKQVSQETSLKASVITMIWRGPGARRGKNKMINVKTRRAAWNGRGGEICRTVALNDIIKHFGHQRSPMIGQV